MKDLTRPNALSLLLSLFFLLLLSPAHSEVTHDNLNSSTRMGRVGSSCAVATECNPGLVCAVGNPLGTCVRPVGITGLATALANIIQVDYAVAPGADGPAPENSGPTVTSRAMAIYFFAAHDAYALCTGDMDVRIRGRRFIRLLENRGVRFGRILRALAGRRRRGARRFIAAQCANAALAAGYFAGIGLYPSQRARISAILRVATRGAPSPVIDFGRFVAATWIRSRAADGSAVEQLDDIFTFEFLRHQPDPNFGVTNATGDQLNFGRFWGTVDPFILTDVATEAFLAPFPPAGSPEFISNLTEVAEFGQCNDIEFAPGILVNDIGTFWGYDGQPDIGVPPRLYLQVVLSIRQVTRLPFLRQLLLFTAVNGAMADAGIAAWLWKFEYDLWRPVLGIRDDAVNGDPEWNPFGIPFSNISPDTVPMCIGVNPNFPAYPSGHSSFGTAAFKTVAEVLGVETTAIRLLFTSDEFNGVTIDGSTNTPRRVITQRLTLEDCITQNQDSRVFNGVHWRFDSIGGDIVGDQIAAIAGQEFSI